jgi:nucleoside-diphosphate-sugar epimerase
VLAEAAARRGARFIHVGSCAEYGHAPAPHREDGPTEPIGPYGALKLEATRLVMALDSPWVVLRPFRTHGPLSQAGLIPAACRAALTGAPFPMTSGEQVREWNHIDTIAAGLLRATTDPAATGHLWNLGGGPALSVRAMVERIFSLAGADPAQIQVGARPQRPGEVPRLVGEHSKWRAAFGPLLGPSLDPGLADTLAGQRAQLGAPQPHPSLRGGPSV